MMEPTPVYICTGFLDSGKTLLVKDTLMEQEWIEPGLTLLILCEEGEEEYSKEYLEENDMVLLKIDKFEQLNAAFFTNCEKNYHPAQVVIEYNGMWKPRMAELPEVRHFRQYLCRSAGGKSLCVDDSAGQKHLERGNLHRSQRTQ